MAEYIIQDTTLSAIADKIREKTESAAIITPESMPQGVENAYDKGYERGVEDTQPIGTIDIDKNGTHYVGGFAYADVDIPIPDGYVKPTGTLSITKNGTHHVKSVEYADVDVPIPDDYIKPTGTLNIKANGTHNVKNVEYAQVNVPIPSGYIKPTGTLDVTDNGEHDVTQYAKVNVAVAGNSMDEFWDKMQSNGSRTNYKGSLGGWSGDDFYPKHNIKPTGDCQYFLMCWLEDGEAIDLDARLIECGITLDFSGVTNLSYFLRENNGIGKLPALNLSGCTAYNYMFYAAKNLVTIGEITANINAAWGEYSFRQCTSLEHITFSPGTIGKSIKFPHSTKLTPESIESIVEGLSDSVSGQTCSINATAVSNYQREYGGSSWISLVQSKPNWTITTV